MIDCRTNISYNAFVKARDEKPWCRTLGPGIVKVIPRETPPHGIYVVTFEMRQTTILAKCRRFDTGADCTPNKYGRWCYHVARAVAFLIDKQQKRDAKAA